MRTKEQIKRMMWENIETETLLRKWKRRFLVALTLGEKQKCKAKIKEYEGSEK
jgi:hypothetical protein